MQKLNHKIYIACFMHDNFLLLSTRVESVVINYTKINIYIYNID